MATDYDYVAADDDDGDADDAHDSLMAVAAAAGS